MKPVDVEPVVFEEPDSPAEDPGQFYTGLVADLYEPLVSAPSQPDDYVPFLEAADLGIEVGERAWRTRWWTRPQFRALLGEAGFERITAFDPAGGLAEEDALEFAFIAQRTS